MTVTANENAYWGFNPPEGVVSDMWWEARAVLERGRVIILPDRASWHGDTSDYDSKLEFSSWIMEQVTSKEMKSLDPTKQELHRVENDKFGMVYDTRGSYGYVYMVAWRKDEPVEDSMGQGTDSSI